MKIGELSTHSGVPVGTIKFYIREGLLPRGRRSAANQARYGVHHLDRIRLIQALTDVARVSIGEAREIVLALQDPNPKPGKIFRRAFDSLAGQGDRVTGTEEAHELEEMKAEIVAFLRALGWSVDPVHFALTTLARSWRSACGLWHPRWLQPAPGLAALRPFAQAMESLAEVEMPADVWQPDEDPSGTLTAAITGSVLFEPILLALRRLAHENRAHALTREIRRTKATSKSRSTRSPFLVELSR